MDEPIQNQPGRIYKVDGQKLVRARIEMRHERPSHDLLLVADTFEEGGYVVVAKLHVPANVTDYMTMYHYLANLWKKKHNAQG